VLAAGPPGGVPDQTGRVVLVTGANTGLGKQLALQLARSGAHVLMACRDQVKGAAAVAEVTRAALGAGVGELVALDLASLASVRACATALQGRPIDVLVNNAGVMAVPRATSVDGHELQFATNVLGPFALTGALLGQLTDRVVWVSSVLHRVGRVYLDDPSFRHRRYHPWRAYAASKLADLMLAYELQRRLTRAGSPVRSVAAHPGSSLTELGRHQALMSWPPTQAVLRRIGAAQSAQEGARPLVYAATRPDLPAGAYVGPTGRGELTGPPGLVGSSSASHDADAQRTLWSLCEGFAGLRVRGGPG
jgi:NAD(P)-dependent dehydrogenase (short-subunit alcohol dehydrogenase family)